MDWLFNDLTKMFPMLNAYLAAGIFVFARLIGFVRMAPVFNRKEIPTIVKLSLVLLLTFVLTPMLKPDFKYSCRSINRIHSTAYFVGD